MHHLRDRFAKDSQIRPAFPYMPSPLRGGSTPAKYGEEVNEKSVFERLNSLKIPRCTHVSEISSHNLAARRKRKKHSIAKMSSKNAYNTLKSPPELCHVKVLLTAFHQYGSYALSHNSDVCLGCSSAVPFYLRCNKEKYFFYLILLMGIGTHSIFMLDNNCANRQSTLGTCRESPRMVMEGGQKRVPKSAHRLDHHCGLGDLLKSGL